MSSGPTSEPAPGDSQTRRRFGQRYAFELDAFQRQAMDCLDAGDAVLVAAPTGSGKTVVAEYGIAVALAAGKRAFYTAPIKALSNQKYAELVGLYGPDGVGLLTGDNSINGEAPVVVMTTEVLRNMIYARSDALDALGVVVLDEVHFLQDTYRGPVWEEVIIHLPTSVLLVCLSATVSNAQELADWITTVRGPTQAIVEHTRPVRLEQLYMVGDTTNDRLHLMPTLVDGRPNSDAQRLDNDAAAARRGGGGGGGGGRGGGRHGPRRKLYTPSRLDVVDRLATAEMLPAIYFIFSRNQCTEAARSLGASGRRLTSPLERSRIRAIVEARVGGLEDDDLEVLGYGAFLEQMEAGIASHHAGMVPPFKEAVEACFAEGLVKVVFATETLAVGINMPARTVVIEKLSKFSGERHTFLTAGEYTQLTGRAGRRGIDDLGHAVVLWSPFVPFEPVATLAASRSFHLHSAFRPTYNMAANLIRRYTREEAQRLLNLSFAQYQADHDLVRLEVRLRRREAQFDELRAAATSPFGDIDEYRSAEARRLADQDGVAQIEDALDELRPGDVIYVQQGGYSGRGAVVTVAHRKGTIRLQVLTTQRSVLTLDAADFTRAPVTLAQVRVPSPYAPHRQTFLREMGRSLERAALAPRPGLSDDGEVDHPVRRDPDLRRRLASARQADRVAKELAQMRQRVDSRDRSVARDFERVLTILTRRGHVNGWRLTNPGMLLAGLFHESDLLIAESIRAGHLTGLDAAMMAGVVSLFVYEHRSSEPAPAPWFPSREVKQRWEAIEALSDDIRRAEERAGLLPHRAPDPTFLAVAFAWAAGESFAEVVAAEELSGGDFVRTMRQLIDLLRQVAVVAPDPATRKSADAAAGLLHRGVVAASLPVASVIVP